MPINPSIPLGIQPLQIQQQDPNAGMNALARMMQLDASMQESQVNRLKADEYKRGIEDKNYLRNALAAPNADPYKIMLGRGMLTEANSYRKNQIDADRAAAEAEAKKLEMAHKRVDSWGQAMGFVRQNPTAENAAAAVQHLVTMGVMPEDKAGAALAQIQQNPTSENISRWAEMGFRTALGAKEQLSSFQTRNTGGTTDTLAIDPVTRQVQTVNSVQNTQSPDNAASVAEQRRAHNMADARARDTAASSRGQFIETTDGYVLADPKTGAVRPVMSADGQRLKGKAADRTLNETQAKANMFGTRMREADRVLNELEDKGVKNPGLIKGAVQGVAGLTPFMGDKLSDAAGSAMNVLPGALGGPNAQQQQVEQARRDFINAVLRKESGAVISPQEFANAERQYFPQPGDSDVVIQQKRANRKRATDLMLAEVPGGARQPAPQGGATGGWDGGPGKVVDFGSLK